MRGVSSKKRRFRRNRRKESSTDGVRVLDKFEVQREQVSTDLLMCVSEAKNVASRRSVTVQLLRDARDAYASGQMDVRILAVGNDAAVLETVSEITNYEILVRKSGTFFFDIATDLSHAQYLLRRYVAVLVANVEERLRQDREQSQSLRIEGLK